MKHHPAAALFRLMSDDELQELAESIREHGLLEPVTTIVVDGEELLLDGRNRVAACELVGADVRYWDYDGNDPVGFVLAENLKRRHLTPGQRAMVALDVEPLYAEQAKQRQLAGVAADLGAGLPTGRARDQAAKATSTSGRAVQQAKRIVALAPDLAERVRSGELALDRADRIIRDRVSEQRHLQELAETIPIQNIQVDIRQGDFRDVLVDLHDIDAIITDPPYSHKYLPLLDELAAFADKVLTEDGVLAVLIGQTYLPEVYGRLDGHRPYRWTMCYQTPRSSYFSHPRRLSSNWKPVLVYGGDRHFNDIVSCELGDSGAKERHKWGQDLAAFTSLVERFTRPGQTVCDPFMGSGTTLVAVACHWDGTTPLPAAWDHLVGSRAGRTDGGVSSLWCQAVGQECWSARR